MLVYKAQYYELFYFEIQLTHSFVCRNTITCLFRRHLAIDEYQSNIKYSLNSYSDKEKEVFKMLRYLTDVQSTFTPVFLTSREFFLEENVKAQS